MLKDDNISIQKKSPSVQTSTKKAVNQAPVYSLPIHSSFFSSFSQLTYAINVEDQSEIS